MGVVGFAKTNAGVLQTQEIKQINVGGEERLGRKAVIDRCEKSAKFLETDTPKITKMKINRAETCVVVEAAAISRSRKPNLERGQL